MNPSAGPVGHRPPPRQGVFIRRPGRRLAVLGVGLSPGRGLPSPARSTRAELLVYSITGSQQVKRTRVLVNTDGACYISGRFAQQAGEYTQRLIWSVALHCSAGESCSDPAI
jgi:hypothetical protein